MDKTLMRLTDTKKREDTSKQDHCRCFKNTIFLWITLSILLKTDKIGYFEKLFNTCINL